MRTAEAEEFRRVCAELDVRPNRALRAMARHAGGYTEIGEAAQRDLTDIGRQLRGIATNINQIARAGNQTRTPDYLGFVEERGRLGPVLIRIQSRTRQILDAAARRLDGRERLQTAIDRMTDELV